jgi:hypothetical protein
MLKLPPDLCFLDEPSHQLGLVMVAFEQHLDGQIAPQVRVAPLEHRPHPSPSDLAEKFVAIASFCGRMHLIRRRLDHGDPGIVSRRVGQQNPRQRPDRLRKKVEDMSGMGRFETKGHIRRRLEPGAEHAHRALPFR